MTNYYERKSGHTIPEPAASQPEIPIVSAEGETPNQRYLVLKGEVKEAEQIRKSVYSILRQEQWEQAQRRTHDMEW